MDGIDKWKEKENTGIAELRKDPKKGFGKLVESLEIKMARSKRENMEELSARKVYYTDWLVVTGRWADFATKDCGGDPISLLAFLNGTNQVEAAIELATVLGIEAGKSNGNS